MTQPLGWHAILTWYHLCAARTVRLSPCRRRADSGYRVSQGYSGQYEEYTNGHEVAIDQAEMAARGMMQQSRGELSGRHQWSLWRLAAVVSVLSQLLTCAFPLRQHMLKGSYPTTLCRRIQQPLQHDRDIWRRQEQPQPVWARPLWLHWTALQLRSVWQWDAP